MVKERNNHCFEPLSFGVVYSIAEDNHYMDQVGMDAKAQPVKTASQFWFLHLWHLVKIFLCKERFYSIFLSFIVINSSNMRVFRPPQKLRNCILSSMAGKGAGWMVSVFFNLKLAAYKRWQSWGGARSWSSGTYQPYPLHPNFSERNSNFICLYMHLFW